MRQSLSFSCYHFRYSSLLAQATLRTAQKGVAYDACAGRASHKPAWRRHIVHAWVAYWRTHAATMASSRTVAGPVEGVDGGAACSDSPSYLDRPCSANMLMGAVFRSACRILVALFAHAVDLGALAGKRFQFPLTVGFPTRLVTWVVVVARVMRRMKLIVIVVEGDRESLPSLEVVWSWSWC